MSCAMASACCMRSFALGFSNSISTSFARTFARRPPGNSTWNASFCLDRTAPALKLPDSSKKTFTQHSRNCEPTCLLLRTPAIKGWHPTQSGDGRRRPGRAEREHLVKIVGKIADGVIAAFYQRGSYMRVMIEHGAVIEHFVASGRYQIVALGPGDRLHGQRTQFVKMMRFDHDAAAAVPQRLSPEIAAQVLLRHDGRIQQDRAPAMFLGEPRGIEPAERAADQRDLVVGLRGERFGKRDCFARRNRQHRAKPFVDPSQFLEARAHQASLERLRRRTKTVQVKDHAGSPESAS